MQQSLLDPKQDLPLVEPTFATIETNVDPHDETTTTTTIVHLPFHLSPQCPPPKVISWMKSSKSAARKHSSSHHRHHQHHSSSRLEKIFPFLHQRRGATSKKGDRSFTLFSIQVTVLGRVLVPTEHQREQGQQKELQKLGSDEDLLSPTRTVPAQLNRSETTSYVIHRTFEDFQRLSEMVLRLQHQLDHDLHRRHRHQQQHSPPQQQQQQQQQQGKNLGADSQPELQPLSALRLHHPHPSLVFSFMKQFMFSNAKANQRAFDASSTTHGFDEEGAYERIIELTQFLEEVWRRLVFSPEQETEGGHHYYPEQHDIMLWFKPSTDKSHADGRQMRDRQQQREQDEKRFQLQQETYGRHSIQVKKRVTMEDTNATSPTLHTGSDLSSSSASPSTSSGSLPGLSSPSSSSVSSMSISATAGAEPTEAADADEIGHMDSASSSASSPTFEGVDLVANYDDDSKKDDLQRRHTVCEGHRRGSQQQQENGSVLMKQGLDANGEDKVEEMPVFTPRRANRSSTMGHHPQEKIKRRISFSHVFRSLTSSGYQRHNADHHHHHSKSASASTPTSPRLDHTSFDEILIWNTVTSKNTPKAVHV